MKRFAFWFVAGLVALSLIRTTRDHRHPAPPRVVVVHDGERRVVTEVHPGLVRVEHGVADDLRDAARDVRDAAREAARDAKEAFREAADDLREAARDAQHEAHEAIRDAHDEAREFVDGVPVPVVPGSRVTEARPEPPQPPQPPAPPHRARVRVRVGRNPNPPAPPAPPKPRPAVAPITVTGRLSATEARAKDDARLQLVELVREKLKDQVPAKWNVPERLLDEMVREVKVEPREKEYGTLYEATLTVDNSPERWEAIVSTYQHQERLKKLAVLGGGLAFLLACLGAISGYIKADEATKGYYTNRLRLASAVGLGAAGVAIYRMLA